MFEEELFGCLGWEVCMVQADGWAGGVPDYDSDSENWDVFGNLSLEDSEDERYGHGIFHF